MKPTNENSAATQAVATGDLFGPPPVNPKRGLVFLHKRIIYPDTKTPAKMVVTCVRNGGIYYRFLGGGGHEYVTLERWPHVAASVPNVEMTHANTINHAGPERSPAVRPSGPA